MRVALVRFGTSAGKQGKYVAGVLSEAVYDLPTTKVLIENLDCVVTRFSPNLQGYAFYNLKLDTVFNLEHNVPTYFNNMSKGSASPVNLQIP